MSNDNRIEEMPSIIKIHGDNIGNVWFSTKVAGTTFIPNSKEFLQFLKNNIPWDKLVIRLFREPENEYDENAVRVEISLKGTKKSKKVGYIPREEAPLLSWVLSHEQEYQLDTKEVVLVGGTEDKPNIGIMFGFRILPIGVGQNYED